MANNTLTWGDLSNEEREFYAEFYIPIVNNVRGAVFYDIGMVSEDAWDVGGDINSNVGIGLRLYMPIGPIRLDFGIPMDTDEQNDGSGKFNFNIGYSF
ncbi:MAG: BamA/TamA family outer membrane protein [Verrucomicrobiales bacterium]|nr:BamA/TamA family outer membrane protein [Verrucomicrobiales bacterium]